VCCNTYEIVLSYFCFHFICNVTKISYNGINAFYIKVIGKYSFHPSYFAFCIFVAMRKGCCSFFFVKYFKKLHANFVTV